MRSLSHWLILALAAPAVLVAQQPGAPKPAEKPDTTPHKPSRLFRAREPVVMWLQTDYKVLFKDRDTTTAKEKKRPGVLRFLDEKGDTVSFDVEIATRGNYRLARLNGTGCAFPPLKVYFDKEKTKGSLFGGEGSLKLSTHCENKDRYTQNTYMEYAIYGMYNVLTPVSLQARLATITYVDPANPKFTITRPGFWIQDHDDMAKEVRGKIVMQMGGYGSQMDPQQMAITDLFQYMIANTDFSLSYLHNYRIVQTDSSANWYPMAYDFDLTGLVDAPYQVVDYRLPIKRVTDRLYRGICHAPEVLTAVIQLYREKKDSIYGVIREIKQLTPARLKEAESFLDEFYKELNDPGTVRRVFNQPCQRG